MNIVQNFKQVVLERYAKFDGRASRAEYWWYVLANVLGSLVLGLLANVSAIFALAWFVWVIGLLIPSLAAVVRRLHDTDRSGWFMLLSFIPFGGLVVVVFLASQGTPGSNKYGAPVTYAAVATS